MKSLAKITWVLWWSENRKFPPPKKCGLEDVQPWKKCDLIVWPSNIGIHPWKRWLFCQTVGHGGDFTCKIHLIRFSSTTTWIFSVARTETSDVIWWDDLWFEDLRKRRRAQQKLFDPCIWVSISLSQVWSWSIYAVIERISANINVLMQSCQCDTSLCQQWTSMQSPNKDYFVKFISSYFCRISLHCVSRVQNGSKMPQSRCFLLLGGEGRSEWIGLWEATKIP